jgi:hypothetical protein
MPYHAAETGSLADVVGRAADRASTGALVTCALAGLLVLMAVLVWALFGRRGQWQLPLAATAVAGLSFGLGGLAHQRLRDEQTQPLPDRARVTTLRLVQRACILSGAAGAIVGAGRVLMGLYGSSFWN